MFKFEIHKSVVFSILCFVFVACSSPSERDYAPDPEPDSKFNTVYWSKSALKPQFTPELFTPRDSQNLQKSILGLVRDYDKAKISLQIIGSKIRCSIIIRSSICGTDEKAIADNILNLLSAYFDDDVVVMVNNTKSVLSKPKLGAKPK